MKEINNSKIKITYIMPTAAAGGAERFLLDLVGNLDKNKFAPSVIFFAGGGFFLDDFKALKIPVIVLCKRFKFDPGNYWQLKKALKKLAPQIVHTQLGGDLYGRWAAKSLGIKVIISTEQNVNPQESLGARILKKYTSRLAVKIVAISQAVKNDLERRYNLPKNKITVIYNGLETKKFFVPLKQIVAPADKSAAKSTAGMIGGKIKRPIIIGSVGRLTKQKNYALLIKALSGLRDLNFECLLAGTGELQSELAAQIERENLEDKIKLVGPIKNVKEFLMGLDLFVLPSLWEGLGIVLLEAGLVGLPVLASGVDGITEIIQDRVTGRLFDKNDAVDLQKKLVEMFKNIQSPEVKNLGVNLQKFVREKFAISKICQEYEDLYLELWKNKK